MTPRTIRIIGFFLLSIILPIANGFASNNARYSIQVLPALQTPVGTLDLIEPVDLNDRGQIVGWATELLTNVRAGFLYTPGDGMKYIDPSGMFNVQPWRINNNGQVVGRDFGSRNYALFLYDPQSGYTSLTKGLPTFAVGHFAFIDMNDAGVIHAASAKNDRSPSIPYRYTAERGWERLDDVYPKLKRFRKYGFSTTHINENGDFTLYLNQKNVIHTYVYYPNRNHLVELLPIYYAADLNDLGWVVGTAYDWTPPPVISPINGRPYLYTPETGLHSIRPNTEAQSSAFSIAADGTVGGCFEKDGNCQSLFTYTLSQGFKFIDERKFRAMLPPQARFAGLEVQPMNDRKELVGAVFTLDRFDNRTYGAWFLYSPQHGLQDLQKLVSRAAPGVKINSIVDFNNHGQILMHVLQGDNSKVAILTPGN